MWRSVKNDPPTFDYVGHQRKICFATGPGIIFYGRVDNLTEDDSLRWGPMEGNFWRVWDANLVKYIEWWLELPAVPSCIAGGTT